MQNESPTVITRVSPELKAELAALALRNSRSVAGETRAALDIG